MRILINFLIRHSSWIVFAIYVTVSCILLFQNNPYQRNLYLSSANRVAAWVYDAKSDVTSYVGLRSVNKEMQLRNGELEMEIITLREQLNDYLALNGDSILRNESALQNYNFIVARVINNSISQINNYITLDKGSLDGVAPEMGIVNQNGVIGIVNVVGEHHSVALSILNPKLRLSCKVKGSDYFGSLVWNAKDARYAMLEEIPRHGEFEKGDTIITSGYSSVFPEGLMVGTISDYEKQRNDNFYALRIKLNPDFGNLGYVHIISNRLKEEQNKIEREARNE